MSFKYGTRANLNGVQVATADIEDDAITSAKIADNAVTAAKISAGTITNAKLAAPTPIVVGPVYIATPNGASVSGAIVLRAPFAGTVTRYGGACVTPPTSGSIGILGYAAINASQLWTSGALNAAGITIGTTATAYAAYTSAPTAYSTVAAGDLIALNVTDAGSGAAGLSAWAEITPS